MHKNISIIFGMVFLFSCGGVADRSDSKLNVIIERPKGFSTQTEHGKIERYKITISGEDIAEPINAEFLGTNSEARIEGVPCGDGRSISVEAINPNGAVVFAADKNNVNISGGVNEIEVKMESVPVFTNLFNGSVVEKNRLVVGIFADPNDKILIGSRVNGAEVSLSRDLEELPISTNESTWMYGLSAKNLSAGEYEIFAKDVTNNRQSSVTVRLVDTGGLVPAPIFSAAVSSELASACAGSTF